MTSAITAVWVGECARRQLRRQQQAQQQDPSSSSSTPSARAESGVNDPPGLAGRPPAAEARARAEPVVVAGYAYSGRAAAVSSASTCRSTAAAPGTRPTCSRTATAAPARALRPGPGRGGATPGCLQAVHLLSWQRW